MMNSDYLRALVDPGGSGPVKQLNSTPVGSLTLPNYDSKMTWVRSTLGEILQLRLQLLDAPILDCDQRTLSLHPHRQSRATWCTSDLHTLLIRIYERYGHTTMKLEGPNRCGLSWIKFYKLFQVEQGRTKQLVHVIWLKPGEGLVNRMHEKVMGESEELRVAQCLPYVPTHGQCTLATEGAIILTPELNPKAVTAPAAGATPTADIMTAAVSTVSTLEPPATDTALTSDVKAARTRTVPTVEATAADAALTENTATPHTSLVPAASIRKASENPEVERWCHVPHLVTDGRIEAEVKSEGRGGPWVKTAQMPTEAKDYGWGIVSCLSMDSMDGDWTLVLDEDFAW